MEYENSFFTPSELEKIREVFCFFTVDPFKKMPRKNILTALLSISIHINNDQLTTILNDISKETISEIDYDQFLTIVQYSIQFVQKNEGLLFDADALFNALDVDNTGVINSQTFLYYLTSLGNKLSSECAKVLFEQFDITDDSYIDFNLFSEILKTDGFS